MKPWSNIWFVSFIAVVFKVWFLNEWHHLVACLKFKFPDLLNKTNSRPGTQQSLLNPSVDSKPLKVWELICSTFNFFSIFLGKWAICFLYSHPQTIINDLWFNFNFQIPTASTENRHESHRSSGRTSAGSLACATGKETLAFFWSGPFHSCGTARGSDGFLWNLKVSVCVVGSLKLQR